MTTDNSIPRVLVPLQGTLAGELFAARNTATAPSVRPQPAAAEAAVPKAGQTPPAMLARLASAQGGLSPLFADLAVAAGRNDLPQPVREAAQALLMLGLDGNALDGEAVHTALLKSGIFAGGTLASGEGAPGDLKSALLSLRKALGDALPEGTRAPVLSSSLPPPHRGASPVAEQPALPSIARLDGEAAALKLMSETDAALARNTLLQWASSPEAGSSQSGQGSHRVVVELPIATPQGHAVIQLQVESEERGRDRQGDPQSPCWRIDFAVDIEPLGPVRARVTEVDGRTHVHLFAERQQSARALQDDLPSLQTKLAQAALEPGDLQCRAGVQQRDTAPSGLFVDRVS